MSAGRPTKWKDEFCEMLVKHMSDGFSFASFGGVIDVSEETLHVWKKEKPEFSESYKTGRLKSMAFWEKLGVAQAIGQTKGSSATWIFNMKNRFQWQDKMEIKDTSDDKNININIKEWKADED